MKLFKSLFLLPVVTFTLASNAQQSSVPDSLNKTKSDPHVTKLLNQAKTNIFQVLKPLVFEQSKILSKFSPSNSGTDSAMICALRREIGESASRLELSNVYLNVTKVARKDYSVEGQPWIKHLYEVNYDVYDVSSGRPKLNPGKLQTICYSAGLARDIYELVVVGSTKVDENHHLVVHIDTNTKAKLFNGVVIESADSNVVSVHR